MASTDKRTPPTLLVPSSYLLISQDLPRLHALRCSIRHTMPASKKQTFRGIDLVRLVGSSSIQIRWATADIIAVEAHLARHRLHLGNYGTLYFFEILSLLLSRDGLTSEVNPEAALIISVKVKSSLQYRLRQLAKDGHVELGRGVQNQHTARWEAYTSLWAEPGWDGSKQPPVLQIPPTPPRDCEDVEMSSPPPVERAVVASLPQTPSSPPATPRLRPQQASSEPWLDIAGFGSQPTLEENLAAFEMPSSTAAAVPAPPASPQPPPQVWEERLRRGGGLPQTPPRRSSAIPVVNNSPSAVNVVAVPVAPAVPASPLSDRYVAMVRAAEQRERARSTSPRPQSSASNPLPPPPPRPPPQQQQRQLLLVYEEEEEEEEEKEEPRVRQEDLTPPRTQTRPRMVSAAPFTLFRDQAKIYIKMHRCALVVLLLTSGAAGSKMSEVKRDELVEEVRQRMRMLAVANAGIERRLAAISLVLAVPSHGSMAIRNLYRVAGVEYAG